MFESFSNDYFNVGNDYNIFSEDVYGAGMIQSYKPKKEGFTNDPDPNSEEYKRAQQQTQPLAQPVQVEVIHPTPTHYDTYNHCGGHNKHCTCKSNSYATTTDFIFIMGFLLFIYLYCCMQKKINTLMMHQCILNNNILSSKRGSSMNLNDDILPTMV